MYIMNRRIGGGHRAHIVMVGLLIVGGIAGSAFAAKQYLQADTQISPPPPPVVSKVLGAANETREFNAGPVTLQLPKDWEQFTPQDAQAGSHSWRNTKGNKGVRVLTIYIDVVPRTPVYNRILAVDPAGDRMIPLGSVSDNCTNFAESGRVQNGAGGNGQAAARWEGVQFTCDTAMYSRNVVGISSTEAPGLVRLAGSNGPHQLAVIYNDADATPNHNLFVSAVESIRLN